MNVIVKLSEVEHALQRPSMYFGSIKPGKKIVPILSDDKFQFQEVEYIEGLLKIINEILDNSIDEAIRTDFEFANTIVVSMTDDTVTIGDNGRGIPVIKDEKSGEYMPVLAFCHARAGSNFDDSNRMTMGMNGVGSFVCNCYSTMFNVVTRDGSNEFNLQCSDNLSKTEYKVSKSKKNGTTVSFKPDLKRFNVPKIEQIYMDLIRLRLFHLAASFPDITFFFNKEKIFSKNAKAYLKMFGDSFEFVETDNYFFGIYPNDEEDFRHISHVNGLALSNGGSHVDYITNEVVGRLREKIGKKYKNVKPGDIRNKLMVVSLLRNFPKCEFDSQTKERLTNSNYEVKVFLSAVNFDELAHKLFKNTAVVNPIIETYRIREELKKRQALNSAENQLRKKVKCDKYYPPFTKNKHLVLAEGDSATGCLLNVLGRSEIGYFSMRGVPLNCYEVEAIRILANEEMKNLIAILGITLSKKEHVDNYEYEDVVLAQDADADGSHISGLLLGFFCKYARPMVEAKRVKKLRTPIITFKKKGKIVEFFFTLEEYQDRIKKDPKCLSKFDVKYFKGLGSWNKEELQQLISDKGLDFFLVSLGYDAEAEQLVNDWLSRRTADARKVYLQDCDFNIFSI